MKHFTIASVAVAILACGLSSCACRHDVGVTVPHISSVAVEYDLPYDYLSAKYRELYRSDPHWFYRHCEQAYASK